MTCAWAGGAQGSKSGVSRGQAGPEWFDNVHPTRQNISKASQAAADDDDFVPAMPAPKVVQPVAPTNA